MSTSGESAETGRRLAYSELLDRGDDEVMRALQDGNADAFAVLFDRYHRLVRVTALRILRDAGEAEDLMQAIFLEFYRSARQYDPARGTLKMWLLQIAYHRSMNRRNYLTVRQFYQQVPLSEVMRPESPWQMPVRPASQESVPLVAQALGQLSDHQKRTLEMIFFEGLTVEDVAARLGQTAANVRHHYYRGLERLRLCLTTEMAPRNKAEVPAFGEVSRAGA